MRKESKDVLNDQHQIQECAGDVIWTKEQHKDIMMDLIHYGCQFLKRRPEYALLKEVLVPDTVTQISNSGKLSKNHAERRLCEGDC